MDEQDTFGESSVVEHQALNLADGGSSPPPRSEHEHTSRASSKGRTPPFEGEDEGSTPSARSTPVLRRGFEITLANGTTLGWFNTRNGDMVLTSNGRVAVALHPDEWPTFIEYLVASQDEGGPPPDWFDITDQEGRIQALIAQADQYAREVDRLTEENDRLVNHVRGLDTQVETLLGVNAHQADIIREYHLGPESRTAGYFEKVARLALQDRDQARSERDIANAQAARLASEVEWAGERDLDAVERFLTDNTVVSAAEGAARLAGEERDMLQGQLERTQKWMERWEAAAAEQGLKRHLAEEEAGRLRTEAAGDREWLRQFAIQVETFAHHVAGYTLYPETRSMLESLLALARQTRERGETADAAGPNPAAARHEGSTPSAPTPPETVNPVEAARRYRRRVKVTNSPPYPFITTDGPN